MISQSSEAQANRLVCPDCHSILVADVAVCPHCQLQLGWLEEGSRERELLERWAVDCLPELLVTAHWAGGQAEARRVGPGELELTAAPLGRLKIHWVSVRQPLMLDWEDQQLEFTAPQEYSLRNVLVTARLVARLPSQPAAAHIAHFAKGLSLRQASGPSTVGRRDPGGSVVGVRLVQQHLSVEMDHCLIVGQELQSVDQNVEGRSRAAPRRYWVIDQHSSTGTFVNRQPVLARQLEGSDLLQVGPFAWNFDSSNERLVPVNKIEGASVQIRHAEGGIVHVADLKISPGARW